MAVGLVFYEAKWAGADEIDLVGGLRRLLSRINRDRRPWRRQVVEKSRLDIFQRHRHFVRTRLGDLVDGAQQRSRCANFTVSLEGGHNILGV
jgi:hypothetical protein